ncbi:MAG: hypothetical protein EOO40_10695 [Deltaproteobacteria bacterium]|nr:MAG: hypothetical protein EOO40_10695 [Deltaproteobacteria bacterium]
MDEQDAILRALILSAAACGAAALLIGGWVSRVAGSYQDGDRRITLAQLGPLVWGQAMVPQGMQAYRGIVLFGRLWLSRREAGEGHLRGLGFTPQQVPWLRGQVTGSLALRRVADTLEGSFFGRKFSFDEEGIRRIEKLAPTPRVWQRL